MPLIKSKSKKAFEENIKAEMESGKPQDQALAIAFNVKRKAKKKMAKGGPVKELPGDPNVAEVIPDRGFGKIIIMKAEGGPVEAQSPRGKTMPVKHPKMVPHDAYSVRMRGDDEIKPQRPKAPDMQPQHNNKQKPYAQGGAVEEAPHSPKSIPFREAIDSDDYQDFNPARRRDFPAEIEHQMMEQPEEEADEMEDASIASAVMARRRMMARGGEILSEDSMESDDSDQADLSRNAQEDANMEDKASFDALRKENYSESEGLMELDHPLDSNLHGDEAEQESENEHSGSLADKVRMMRKSHSR